MQHVCRDLSRFIPGKTNSEVHIRMRPAISRPGFSGVRTAGATFCNLGSNTKPFPIPRAVPFLLRMSTSKMFHYFDAIGSRKESKLLASQTFAPAFALRSIQPQPNSKSHGHPLAVL